MIDDDLFAVAQRLRENRDLIQQFKQEYKTVKK